MRDGAQPLFGTTLVANGVWIGFDVEPELKDIAEARRLLDQLTDDLILKKGFDDEQ